MKKLFLNMLFLSCALSVSAQDLSTVFRQLGELAAEVGIRATDIYHTQWPGDTIRPYVVKGFDELGTYVDAYEKALLALEKQALDAKVFDLMMSACSDTAAVEEFRAAFLKSMAEGREYAGQIRTNLDKYQKDKGTLFAVKSVTVLQARIGSIYLGYGEGKELEGLVAGMRAICP
jgi:hypothetical protein